MALDSTKPVSANLGAEMMTMTYPFPVSADEFKGTRVLVTGGTKGIGHAVAARLGELLGRPVPLLPDCIGPEVEAAAHALLVGHGGERVAVVDEQHPHRRLPHICQGTACVLVDAIGDPLEVVDHPHQGAATRGETDRSEIGAQEIGSQRVHRAGYVVR